MARIINYLLAIKVYGVETNKSDSDSFLTKIQNGLLVIVSASISKLISQAGAQNYAHIHIV